MILIGQYDSPFVRRVAITLRLYGLSYEHRPWSVWRDADRIAEHNPLKRVPTLLLEDGMALVETAAIIDALDDLVGEEQLLLPRTGPARREGLRIVALSTGLADKAVSLLYETLFRSNPSQVWTDRCRAQIRDTLTLLEAERASRPTPYWFGSAITHAGVAFACALRFTREAHTNLLDLQQFPALAAQATRCEGREEFRATVQPIMNNL